MAIALRKTIFTAAAVAGLAGLTLGTAMPGPARADDESFEQRILNNLMRGLGLQSSRDSENAIQYRERAPLVLPASRDLPPPETASAAAREPAWPVDPDVKARAERRKQAVNARTMDEIETGRLLTYQEMSKFEAAAARQRNTGRGEPTIQGVNDPTNPIPARQMGAKGNLFSSIWSKFSPEKDEVAKFTGEPERTSLTEPPSGYQVPSPSRPYGITTTTPANARVNAELSDRAVSGTAIPR